MKQFIAICAKNGQRVELAVQYPSIEIARDELHNQGYSIMELYEADSNTLNSNGVFLFEILVNGNKKSGQIKSNDIFKAYIKLVDDLHYEVLSIYSEGDITPEDQSLTTQKVKESYTVYKNLLKNEGKKEENKDIKNGNEENFFEKDLIKYRVLIENIIKKIENLLLKYSSYLNQDRVIRLKNLITSLQQIKNITNTNKLCLIGEAALLKIGELEKELVEKQTEIKKDEFFKETNSLLKQFGSTKRIVTEEDQIKSKLKTIFHSFFSTFEEVGSQKKENTESTENNFLYYKNLRELDIYKNKLKETKKDIFTSFFHFQLKGDLKTRLLLKKKLIEQNINLLNNRISQRNIPYMRIIKGISYYSDVFFYLVRSLWDLFLYSLFLYSLGFFFFESYNEIFYNIQIHHISIYFITLLSVIGFLLKQVRTPFSLLFSSIWILFFSIFFTINF